MIRDIRRNYIPQDCSQPEYDPVFQECRKTTMMPLIGKERLVNYLEYISENVAKELVNSLEHCLAPYMCLYSAMEIIDPTAPGVAISIENWETVEVMCNKYDLIISMRGEKLWRCVRIMLI